MIPGFNTDIEHNGTVYHVQTEDKGAPKRVIMSLVYDKGTILASKRESYADLGIDPKALADRVGRQHKLICAAVKAGRINELKAMSIKPTLSQTGSAQFSSQAAEPPSQMAEPPPREISAGPVTMPAPQPRPESTVPKGPLKITLVEPEPIFVVPTIVPTGPLEPVIDAVRIIEDRPVLTADAVEIVSELSGQDRPTHQKLSLELLSDSKFKGGDRRTVNIMICRGTARRVVPNAQIMVKVLGSTFRPVIFHARSDANGLAKVHLQLPHFQAGRAALLVRAMSDGEEIELRRVVTPG